MTMTEVHKKEVDALKDKLLTVEDVQKIFRLKNKHTIYNWVNKNKIPYVKIGKMLYFKRSEIERMINVNSYTRDTRGAI